MKKLLLAISKGRILEEALEILGKSGIKCLESPFTSRKLIFNTNYENLEIIIVRASDVPIYIESGKVGFGIVGKDTLLESNLNNHIRLTDLNIAACKLVVAGKKGTELKNNMKVATKYPTITKKFFQNKGLPCSVLKLYGSIELAAVLGLSDVVVDLVESGQTLKQNGLIEIEVIDKISSMLIVNKTSYKLYNKQILKLLKKLELD
ncbi:MAG: ATP phosphoribosyltransferase [Pseudomonadota bacterium]|nr:ATP phosphoribosyltransferase [Pseudomonadota bacterium]